MSSAVSRSTGLVSFTFRHVLMCWRLLLASYWLLESGALVQAGSCSPSAIPVRASPSCRFRTRCSAIQSKRQAQQTGNSNLGNQPSYANQHAAKETGARQYKQAPVNRKLKLCETDGPQHKATEIRLPGNITTEPAQPPAAHPQRPARSCSQCAAPLSSSSGYAPDAPRPAAQAPSQRHCCPSSSAYCR